MMNLRKTLSKEFRCVIRQIWIYVPLPVTIYKKYSSNSTSKSMNSISADADNVKYDEFKIL